MGEGILSQLINDYPRTPEHGSYSVTLTHWLRRVEFKEAVCPMNLEWNRYAAKKVRFGASCRFKKQEINRRAKRKPRE